MIKAIKRYIKTLNFRTAVAIFVFAVTVLIILQIVISRLIEPQQTQQQTIQQEEQQRIERVEQEVLNQFNGGNTVIIINDTLLTEQEYTELESKLKQENPALEDTKLMPSGELLRKWKFEKENEELLKNPPREF